MQALACNQGDCRSQAGDDLLGRPEVPAGMYLDIHQTQVMMWECHYKLEAVVVGWEDHLYRLGGENKPAAWETPDDGCGWQCWVEEETVAGGDW